jgi:hypothetical protein
MNLAQQHQEAGGLHSINNNSVGMEYPATGTGTGRNTYGCGYK